MTQQAYSRLVVWQKAMSIVVAVYRLTMLFPRDERFGMVAQLRSAAISVPSNIAEGHGRATRGEYLNQLSVASGSLNEIHTLLQISRELEFAPAADVDVVNAIVEEVLRLMAALRRSLRRLPAGRPDP